MSRQPISRSQIANYESGRKKSLDVAELLVIAAALGVPPLRLLFPDEPDDDIEMPSTATPLASSGGNPQCGQPTVPRHDSGGANYSRPSGASSS